MGAADDAGCGMNAPGRERAGCCEVEVKVEVVGTNRPGSACCGGGGDGDCRLGAKVALSAGGGGGGAAFGDEGGGPEWAWIQRAFARSWSSVEGGCEG